MGYPSTHGDEAASAAQVPQKAFPDGTDPASITLVSGLPDAVPTLVGSPVVAQGRQARPAGEWGAGYREVPAEGSVH
jgi:hypothetical protein